MTVSTELDTRFRDAAAAARLLDVGFDVVESPIGPLLMAATERGLCRISFQPDPERHLDRLAKEFGPRVLRSSAAVDTAHEQLDEYFAGARRGFQLDVDLRATAPFAQRVLDELALVPFGETTTYGTLAGRVGAPRAARAVGTVMNRNPLPIVLPCHRVVGSNGSLTGYGGGLHVKEHLLRLEGVLL
ncbi:MAG: methylated-DNA--[protein]-cysteine S-methyltransferase [Actinobacteria bacterium]|nr:methylated-DNA--[protein]-cysteine S-methyltransferase [Actinomycetota bacterium]MDQ3162718.1 methylated-DNA--[protein]-cysteine S-methyltransferase [Actinomycetota bacterium]